MAFVIYDPMVFSFTSYLPPHPPIPTNSVTIVILFYNYEWYEWPLSWSCHYFHPSQQEFQSDDVEQDSEERAQASVLGKRSFWECCLA